MKIWTRTWSQTCSMFMLFCWWQHPVGSLAFPLYTRLPEGGPLTVSPPSEASSGCTTWSAGGFEAAAGEKLRSWIRSGCPQTHNAGHRHLMTCLSICHQLPLILVLPPFNLLNFALDALSLSCAVYSNLEQPLQLPELSYF